MSDDVLPCPLTQPSSSPCCSKTLSRYQRMGAPPDSCLLLRQNGLSLQSQASCPSGVIQSHAGFQPLLLPTFATEEWTILPRTKLWLKIIEKRIFKWPGPYILQKAWPSYVSHQGKNDQKNKLFSTYLPKVGSAGLVRVLIMSYSQSCPPHPHLEPVRSRADPMDSCGGLSWTNNRCFPLRRQERTRAPLDSHLWVSHSPLQPLRGLARPTSPPWSVQAPVPDTDSQHWPRTSTRWLWPGVFLS